MSTPPLLPSDDSPGQTEHFDPLRDLGEPARGPPSPPIGGLPRPATPHLSPQTFGHSPTGSEPSEAGSLKCASAAGSLQDVHQILAQYILTQTPDSRTGRLSLSLFYRAVTEAIINNHAPILSYLFFMRVGEPSKYLYCALRAESCSIFQVFLNYGWDINQPIERTKAPALGYISHNRELTEWFLDHGADPNTRCAWDITPMSEAMYRAPLDTIKRLFERGGDLSHGQLLHNAVLRDGSDTIELVCLLLDMGAPINAIQYQNHSPSYREQCALGLGTPLHYAAEEDRADLVVFLLQRGANPLIKNTKGRTVLETAVFLKKFEAVRVLESNML